MTGPIMSAAGSDPVQIIRGYVEGRYGQIHYRATTQGETGPNRPLVLLHQNPSSSFEYELLMLEMGRDRRVIALDTPGYGMSDGPPEPLSIADYAQCMAECLPHLGIAPPKGCDAYGFHTGSILVVELALSSPDLVHRIGLTGLPMRTADERAERLQTAKNARALDENGDVVLATARALWNYVVKSRTADVSLRRAAENWIEKLRPLDRAQWAYHGVWSYDFAERLPRLQQPALLLQPHEDLVQYSIAAAKLIPDHSIVEMPEFTRDLLDTPDAIQRMGAALRRFLDVRPL